MHKVIKADTTKPTSPARYASGTSSMPIFVKTSAKARITAAPIGNASAHNGQLVEILLSFFASNIIARTITIVPIAVGTVKISPKHKIPNTTPNNGLVEVKVEESVGPRSRIPAKAKLADTAGRNKPISTNIKTAGCIK